MRAPSPVQMALELPEAVLNDLVSSKAVSTATAQGEGRWVDKRAAGGNTKREKPTTSYFYCWDEPVKRDGQTEYQRHQVYVPVQAIARVQEMIAERQPVAVVLDAIAGAKHWWKA